MGGERGKHRRPPAEPPVRRPVAPLPNPASRARLSIRVLPPPPGAWHPKNTHHDDASAEPKRAGDTPPWRRPRPPAPPAQPLHEAAMRPLGAAAPRRAPTGGHKKRAPCAPPPTTPSRCGAGLGSHPPPRLPPTPRRRWPSAGAAHPSATYLPRSSTTAGNPLVSVAGEAGRADPRDQDALHTRQTGAHAGPAARTAGTAAWAGASVSRSHPHPPSGPAALPIIHPWAPPQSFQDPRCSPSAPAPPSPRHGVGCKDGRGRREWRGRSALAPRRAAASPALYLQARAAGGGSGREARLSPVARRRAAVGGPQRAVSLSTALRREREACASEHSY